MAPDGAADDAHGLRFHAAVNAFVNFVIAGGLSYGIARLLTTRWTWAWYTHDAEIPVERETVVGEALSTGFLNGIIITLIVGTIVYHLWDKGEVAPTDSEWLLLTEERTRVQHLLRFGLVLGTGLGLLYMLSAFLLFPFGAEYLDPSTFVWYRTFVGASSGFLVGGAIAVSVIVNLSHGKLVDASDEGPLIGRVSMWSSRNAKKVAASILVVTLLFGSGIADIHTDVDVADVLPRGNQNTKAAHNLTDRFQSSYTQEAELQFYVDREACLEDSRRNLPQRHGPNGEPSEEVDCGNITDEVYLRAMEEFYTFLSDYEYDPEEDEEEDGRSLIPEDEEDEEEQDDEDEEGLFADEEVIRHPMENQIGLTSFYKLINWTLAGGRDDAPPGAYSLPPPEDRDRWNTVHETAWASIASSMTPIIDEEFNQSVVLYMPNANTTYESQQIGRFMIEARDAYVEWAEQNADYKVFTGDNKPIHTVDLPVANAHSSDIAENDFRFFLPLITYVLVIALFAAFRNTKSVLVAGGSLSLGVAWTYGLMGHMNIPLNNLNLTVLPLIMGNGIDYAIHMINEFLEHKAEGLSDAEAFSVAGGRAGFAMLVATVTTVTGLAIMIVSPSLLLAQLGLLAAIAMVSVYLLTIIFIPAVLTLWGGTEKMGADFSPSTLMPALGRFVHRHRAIFAVLVVLATVVAPIGLQNIEIREFGEPALNWPESDEMRQEHVRGLQGFYEVDEGNPPYKANIVVVEGDITDPETHDYLDALHSEIQEAAGDSDIVDARTARHLPFLIRTWLTVRDGPESIPVGLLSQEMEDRGYENRSQYPQTREGIQRILDQMFASPNSEFSSLFVDYPANNITVITYSIQTGSYDRAAAGWRTTQEGIQAVEDQRPDDVWVSMVGNTATNYLFVNEQLPWLNYMSFAALAAAVLLVYAATRDLKATLAVGLIVGLTSLWVLAMLPLMGIGLAITLMLPLIFIFSIGSDYAVHMIWNIKQVGDPERVYETVGKAIMFSAITDMGAFAVLVPVPGTPLYGIRDLMVREAMITTVASIGVIFLSTIVVVSLLYDPTPADVAEAGEPDEGEAPSAPDSELPSVTVRTE